MKEIEASLNIISRLVQLQLIHEMALVDKPVEGFPLKFNFRRYLFLKQVLLIGRRVYHRFFLKMKNAISKHLP